jgi:N-acetylglutamate synthase-like GNAT family acetyltransferase
MFPSGNDSRSEARRAVTGDFRKNLPTMGSIPEGEVRAGSAFSEKSFYLSEFRGRTLAIAVPAADLGAPGPLESVLQELEAGGSRVVVISTQRSALEGVLGLRVLSAALPRLEAAVWRAFAEAPRIGVAVAGSQAFAPACREIVLRLGVGKLVWIDREGGLLGPDGNRESFVDRAELEALLASGGAAANARRVALLREIEEALDAGIAAVNVCTLEGLPDELFTYGGSGTLFTRERYVVVRRLCLDDYDAADDLIARGVAEGFLAPRPPQEIERVLTSGFGAFVEGRHLAGIGALLVIPSARAAELASLYTLTRFLGEGIGAHLIHHALDRARALGSDYVFACTVSERVAGFFERNGFRRVPPAEIPAEKWRDYDAERRASVLCLRRDLEKPEPAAAHQASE